MAEKIQNSMIHLNLIYKIDKYNIKKNCSVEFDEEERFSEIIAQEKFACLEVKHVNF